MSLLPWDERARISQAHAVCMQGWLQKHGGLIRELIGEITCSVLHIPLSKELLSQFSISQVKHLTKYHLVVDHISVTNLKARNRRMTNAVFGYRKHPDLAECRSAADFPNSEVIVIRLQVLTR